MKSRKRQDGTPVWINKDSLSPLRRVELSATSQDSYNEAWLQHMIDEHPGCLPITQIEPGFGRVMSACRELPLSFGAGKTGALDNVLVTDSGGLVLVEAKLWRNPEARRTVVAQAMEYAAAVFRLSYEQFEDAIRQARLSAGKSLTSLYELIASDGEMDERSFVDAVTRNLMRGRAVVAVVGDGIREDIMPLAELLQAHAGSRFTFALIELGVFEVPTGEKVVMPSVLAQTTLIERGVVSIREEGAGGARISVTAPAESLTSARGQARAIGIGEDEFYELLEQREPGLSAKLKSFLARADEELGVFVDRQGGLNLKHEAKEGPPLNLGTIRKDGFVDTGPSSWWDRTEAGLAYNESLASTVGGQVSSIMAGQQSALRTRLGKTPRLSELLPEHADAWLLAMRTYISTLTL